MASNTPNYGARAFFPLNLDLRGKRVLVFGGGKAAFEEIKRFLEFGAQIDVVAPHLIAELRELASVGGRHLRVHKRSFGASDLTELSAGTYLLVLALSDSPSENDSVVKAANEKQVLVCYSYLTERSDFLIPTVLKRGHLKISVSTDGINQALEKTLMRRIESALQPSLDKYLIFLNVLAEKLNILTNENHYSEATKLAIQARIEESEELGQALERHKFEEARSIIERIFAEEGTIAAHTTTA